MLDVCICTHNPQRPLLQTICTALAQQTLSPAAFRVWVIDNASDPALTAADVAPLEAAGITYTILLERRLGLSYARWCAIETTDAEVVVFVDDDNELAPDYLENALTIAKENPDIGCFGGKMLLATQVQYPTWMENLLPYLGIRDYGDEVISNSANHWGEWEPAGAGIVARRSVLVRYLDRLKARPSTASLGRQGSQGLFSCEDSLIARGAYELGYQCSYQPSLVLKHHIHAKRFQLKYLVKLLYAYGRSYVMLERSLDNDPPVMGVRGAMTFLINNIRARHRQHHWLYSLCLAAWDVGYCQELRFGASRHG